MPCGTGKTLTAYWLADKLKAKNVIVAVPSLNLIRQCLRSWAIESTADKKRVNWIAVCSDKKVKDLNKDDFQVLVRDLGIRAHTDIGETTDWLKRKKTGRNIIFTTYDSGPNLAKASKKAKFKFDLGIFDEAHRTAGAIDSQSSILLFDKNIDISKRVFLTATERKYRGQSDEIICMDDTDIYGERCHYLSFKESLEHDPPILTDYEIILIYTSKKEILKLIKKNILIKPKTGKWNSIMEARSLSNLAVLNKTFKDTKAKHCISYHSSIDRADAFASSQEEFSKKLKFKNIKTFHVNSRNMTVSARERIIKSFESTSPSLMTNARCLSEGVDIPKVDSILFADPRESRVDIVQAMGRALRTEKNKKKSYLMIPAMVDEEGILDDKDFQTITTVISDIGSNDEQLIDWFESVSKGKKKKGKVKVIVPKGTKVDFQKITEALQIKIYDRLKRITKKDLTEEWIIEKAKEYKEKHNQWPSEYSDEIEGTKELWSRIDKALYNGFRGLPGGSSLNQLLIKHGLKEKQLDLTEEWIIEKAKEYQENHEDGMLPYLTSGKVEGTNESWRNLSANLKKGHRGLPGGISLPELFIKHGLKEKQLDLTEEWIIEKAKEYKKKHEKWPSDSSGEIEGTIEKWKNIDAALSNGDRGLSEGSSIHKLLVKHKLKIKKKQNLTEAIIIKWAKAHKKKHGNWPTQNSGDIKGTEDTWRGVQSALQIAGRGLKNKSTIFKLLKKYKLK